MTYKPNELYEPSIHKEKYSITTMKIVDRLSYLVKHTFVSLVNRTDQSKKCMPIISFHQAINNFLFHFKSDTCSWAGNIKKNIKYLMNGILSQISLC